MRPVEGLRAYRFMMRTGAFSRRRAARLAWQMWGP